VERLITDTILQYGLLAVFVLMTLESACIPIPSEITMLFGGALANASFVASLGAEGRQLNFVAVGLAGTLGNLVGSWIAWGVGWRGGRPLIERWGRYVFLRKHELDRAEVWFQRHGEAAVFVSRLLPVIRTFISLPAGIAEMRFLRFSVYTFLGCLPWTFALAALGYVLGSQWHVVDRYLRPISIVIAVLVVVAAGWWLYRRWKEQRRLERADAAGETEEETAADRR
jgi:membrane protein DedA with SNARE-associated domain